MSMSLGLRATATSYALRIFKSYKTPKRFVSNAYKVKADDAEEEVEEFKKPPLAAGLAGYLHVWVCTRFESFRSVNCKVAESAGIG